MPPQSRPGVGTIAALASTTLISISLFIYRRRRCQTAKSSNKLDNDDLPYPPTPSNRNWLFGHALSLQPLPDQPKASHDLIFLHWIQKLKSKVVMFELPLLGRMIVIGDAQIAKYVLQNSSTFHKSPTYRVITPLVGKKSLVATEGKEWSSQRRLYNPGFSPEFLKGIVGTIVEKCDRFVARCDNDIENENSTNMLDRAIDLTSDVIAQVAFGEDWGMDDDDVDCSDGDSFKYGSQTLRTIRDLTVMVGENMKNPLQRYFDFKSMWKTWRLSVALDRDMQCLVQRRLESLRMQQHDTSTGASQQKDILSLTLSSVLHSKQNLDPTKPMHLSHDDIENMTSQLKTFYFAGHDTTATTIAWAYWLLVQHPDCLKRARDEVVASLGKSWVDDAVSGNKLGATTYELLQHCTYLDAVSRETLRLYPPAASTRYATDHGASCGGFLLGDSIVHLNFYAIQRDPDFWEDCDSFVPERFLGDAGKKLTSSFSFLPFSKGSRDCIGKYFALLETKIALAALICRYDGIAVDPNEVYTTRLTSIPDGGCRVKLRHRS